MLEKDRISYFYDGTFTAPPLLLPTLTLRCETLALAIVATRYSLRSYNSTSDFGVPSRTARGLSTKKRGFYGD